MCHQVRSYLIFPSSLPLNKASGSSHDVLLAHVLRWRDSKRNVLAEPASLVYAGHACGKHCPTQVYSYFDDKVVNFPWFYFPKFLTSVWYCVCHLRSIVVFHKQFFLFSILTCCFLIGAPNYRCTTRFSFRTYTVEWGSHLIFPSSLPRNKASGLVLRGRFVAHVLRWLDSNVLTEQPDVLIPNTLVEILRLHFFETI